MSQGFTKPTAQIVKDSSTVSGGTATRILYEGAGPVVTDSANLTFNGVNIVVSGGQVVDIGKHIALPQIAFRL